MASRRWKPLDKDDASTPPAAAPAERAPTLSVLAMPLESLVPSFSPPLAMLELPSALLIEGAIFEVSAVMDI